MAEIPASSNPEATSHPERVQGEKVLRPITLCLDIPDSDTQVEIVFKEPDRLTRTAREIRDLAALIAQTILSRRILVNAEEGTLGVERADVPLDDVLSDLQSLCRSAEWGHQGTLEILPGAGGNLRTDPVLLQRALHNLLANAFEAIPPGGKVTLQVEADAGGHTFCIHSPGEISPNVAPRIFQRAFSTKTARGRGLGSYAARLLVERFLGGTLTFQTGPQEGTQFLLRIPKAMPSSQGILTATTVEEPPPAPFPPPPGEAIGTVLIVDDSITTRQVLASVLAREHQVLTANNGEECLKIAREQTPDLILLDIIMPGMDGFAVCAHLKSDPRTEEIPVLFLTGLTGEGDETLALEAGALDFLTKPISPVAVAARVRNHMELKRTRDRLRDLTLLDGLTGIANRRRFDRQIDIEWQRARRRTLPLSVILGDVDYFKRYNDYYGHAQGDVCLRSVAHAFLRALLRPADLVARYGGEEFVCVLPDTDLNGALEVAERIRTELQERQIPHANSEVASIVTLSLGVACVPTGEQAQLHDLLEQADAKLYQAKREGRDRCCG